MKTKLDRLIQLNEKTDGLLEFKKLYDPSTGQWVDEPRSGVNTAANLAVGAGVLGAGGYAGQRAINTAGGYGAVATKLRGQIAPVIAEAKPKLAALGTTASTKVAALLAKLKGVRLQSRETRVISLSSKLDSLLEFQSPAA